MASKGQAHNTTVGSIDLSQTDVNQLRIGIKWRVDHIHKALTGVVELTDVQDTQSARQKIKHILEEVAYLTLKAEELEQYCAEQFW